MRALPHTTSLVTRTGISAGAVAGGPQALVSAGSGAVAHAVADAGADADHPVGRQRPRPTLRSIHRRAGGDQRGGSTG